MNKKTTNVLGVKSPGEDAGLCVVRKTEDTQATLTAEMSYREWVDRCGGSGGSAVESCLTLATPGIRQAKEDSKGYNEERTLRSHRERTAGSCCCPQRWDRRGSRAVGLNLEPKQSRRWWDPGHWIGGPAGCC